MKQAIFVISEWGYWGEELMGPLEACERAGYTITFVTPTGKKPTPLAVSMDPKYIDPPLGRSVTSEDMAVKTRKLHESDRLNRPRSLEEWFPRRPYTSSAKYLREMEAYYERIDKLVA